MSCLCLNCTDDHGAGLLGPGPVSEKSALVRPGPDASIDRLETTAERIEAENLTISCDPKTLKSCQIIMRKLLTGRESGRGPRFLQKSARGQGRADADRPVFFLQAGPGRGPTVIQRAGPRADYSGPLAITGAQQHRASLPACTKIRLPCCGHSWVGQAAQLLI